MTTGKHLWGSYGFIGCEFSIPELYTMNTFSYENEDSYCTGIEKCLSYKQKYKILEQCFMVWSYFCICL